MKSKVIIYIIGLLAGVTMFASCNDEELGTVIPSTEGMVSITFKASLLEEQKVITRAIDPDGKAVKTLWLFCFDENHLFVGRGKATELGNVDGETQTSGTFKAEVSPFTRYIHYLVNVNLDAFEDRNFLGTSESHIIPNFVSNSGRLAYWGRGSSTLQSDNITLKPDDEPVILYRSQASVSAESSTTEFEVLGISVCNKWLSGTAAPFNQVGATEEERFAWKSGEPFTTYHSDMQKAINTTDIRDGETEEYIFEHENTSEDPISVILKGRVVGGTDAGTYYYKIQLVDTHKRFYKIYRNYRYTINVSGNPGKGHSSFANALNGGPYNNPLFNVSAELPSISSGDQSLQLKIGSTTIIVNEDDVSAGEPYTYKIPYQFREYEAGTGWVYKQASNLELTLNDGFIREVEKKGGDSNEDNKYIEVTFNGAPRENTRIGKLTIWGGILNRTVTLYYTKKFTFSPIFMTDKLGNALSTDGVATLTFTVPDNYPAALFPIDCKIEAPNLNPMESLPVILEGSYGYLYRVEGPGTYNVKFKNISTPGNSATGTVKLFADNFNTAEKTFTYQTTTLQKLSSSAETLQLAPAKGATATFTLTSRAETISIYSRYAEVTSPTPASTEVVDAATGLTKYTFTVTGTGNRTTPVAIKSLKPLSAEALNIEGSVSSSLAVEVKNNPAAFNFDFKIDGTSSVSYKPGTPVNLTFNLPDNGFVPGGEYYLLTKNLASTDTRLTKNAGGYTYKPTASGSQTLQFITTNVASAETVTLMGDAADVIYNTASLSYTNPAITGTVTFNNSSVPSGEFVAVERIDGLRIGSMAVGSGGGYTLTFHPDYILKSTDKVIFTYTSSDSEYQLERTIEELVTGGPVQLSLTKN